MKIATIQHAVPSRAITNDWVIEQIRAHNGTRFSSQTLDAIEGKARKFFATAGTRTRYGLADGEKALDFVLAATRRALVEADVSPDEIEFVIYAGVGRAWVEPAMANLVQREIGLMNATCFDVLDACVSWLRALQLAWTYLRNGTYRCGLVVDCECGFVPYKDWELPREEDLDQRLAAWTIGEAATATVVIAENPADDFYFSFKSFGQYADLCVFPLATARDFFHGSDPKREVPMRLYTRSRELLTVATQKIVEMFRADEHLSGARYDLLLGHAASEHASVTAIAQLGLPERIYFSTHADYGNTVSASVPLGLCLARDAGRLRRGDRVLVVVAGSGVTVGMASFTY